MQIDNSLEARLGLPDSLLDKLLGLDRHSHKCPAAGCGVVWSHAAACIKPGTWDAAHSCPACGTEQTYKVQPDGSDLRVKFSLTEREARTIVAALELRQELLDDGRGDAFADVATDRGRLSALDANEIDHLTERLGV